MRGKIPKSKLDLVRALSAKADVSQTKVEIMLAALASFAYAGATVGRGFSIPGLGRLCLVKRKARKAFNPKTRKAMKVPAKMALAFRVSDTAKKAVLGHQAEAKKKRG